MPPRHLSPLYSRAALLPTTSCSRGFKNRASSCIVLGEAFCRHGMPWRHRSMLVLSGSYFCNSLKASPRCSWSTKGGKYHPWTTSHGGEKEKTKRCRLCVFLRKFELLDGSMGNKTERRILAKFFVFGSRSASVGEKLGIPIFRHRPKIKCSGGGSAAAAACILIVHCRKKTCSHTKSNTRDIIPTDRNTGGV